jgi:hypothetical protein
MQKFQSHWFSSFSGTVRPSLYPEENNNNNKEEVRKNIKTIRFTNVIGES